MRGLIRYNPTLWALCVMLSAGGCKGCDPGGPPPPPGAPGPAIEPLEGRLSLTSVEPGRVPVGQPFSVVVRGAGFERGATVSFGAEAATKVTVLNPTQLAVDAGALPAGRYDAVVRNPDGATATLRAALLVEGTASSSCDPATVYFETDRSTLGADGKGAVASRAACYAAANAAVRVEGHADERGTTDYNLALGERRAIAVKAELVERGVSEDRVTTTSFGEEQPIDDGHNDAAWSKNRRAEVSVGR